MQTDDLRRKFLEFFESKSHKIFPSDTLVPDDPTVLFTSAGMNQFKPYFLGEKAEDFRRAASCQKCLRTGDLEKVGKTAYHHTFFEMLGNFSFGDYFKKEAIEFAWEFFTKELNIKEEKLWVSVYKDDAEAYNVWRDYIGVPKDKIILLGQDSNFWPANAPSKGPNGPCGPCSEIFFDRGKDKGCRKKTCNPDCDCGRFVEVWNLVFTQFNRVGDNELKPLPQKNIDTGMGLERMASVLQNKESNFQIDILQPVVKLIREILGITNSPVKLRYGVGKLEIASLINAIADHSRAATFAIADGVYPSNEERGYVIRKIIRKASWSANLLNYKKPFVYLLTNLFAELMGGFYPELIEKKEIIARVIKAEEEKFLSTLKGGKQQLMLELKELKKKKRKRLSAEVLFRLYDTYGFPLELSKDIAEEHKVGVDEEGFKVLFQKQQQQSRKKSMFDESIFKGQDFNLKEKSKFLGYKQTRIYATVERLFVGKEEREKITKDEEGLIILDKTPFYPESGGQLSDKGIIQSRQGEFVVEEVFKINEAIVHKGRVKRGKIEKEKVLAVIDISRRKALARAHTATHLLQAALRQVLGKHVVQQGSLVDEDRLRFDFTHFNKLTEEEIKKVRDKVKKFISQADKVEKKELKLKEAKKEGALAFFKDKYQDEVRVVSVSDYSKELCGGTHVENTSQIEDFEIESESSVSSGIRRIRASVAKEAEIARAIRRRVKEQMRKSLEENRKLGRIKINQAVAKEEKKFISQSGNIKGIESINGVNSLFDFDKANSSSTKEEKEIILKLSDRLRQKIGSVFIFIVRNVAGKNIFICSATDDLIKKEISCIKFISKFSKELSLVGGGTKKLVQGIVLDRGEDFLGKLKKAFRKFIVLEIQNS